ncbi:hypothetical protein DFH11DRAFT_1690128 [Phellopilus nigrolimitatus]|nr:hypothetical protein DFH11DRAFT_1690128 [Phellopilus nigrolimitatus]
MNGSIARGTESVWAALDRLRQPLTFSKDKKGKGKDKATEVESAADNAGAPGEGNEEIEGSNDIMLYSPLIPDRDSLVEMGASEVVTLYDDEREMMYRAELRRRWADGRGFIPFESLETIEDANADQSEDKVDDKAEAQAEDKAEEKVEKKPKPKERVVWMPSPTQISVQVLWWGYRMYLPPPVLQVLNNKSLEAAKRAAIITSALKWLLDHLPLTLLPLPLRPAATLLTGLVPLLGAIGTFIAWSWRAIGTFDKGHGVVLSATWLMPVILIPGTWEDDELPRSGQDPRPDPIPAPTQNLVQQYTPIAGPSRRT